MDHIRVQGCLHCGGTLIASDDRYELEFTCLLCARTTYERRACRYPVDDLVRLRWQRPKRGRPPNDLMKEGTTNVDVNTSP